MWISGRDLVRQVFASSLMPRIPFIPLLCSHAARLDQISTEEMITDPTQMSKALQNAQALYDCDAVTCVFDPTLEAEACGYRFIWGDYYDIHSVSEYPADDLG